MTRMVLWKVTHKGETVEIEAATPESAAKKANGTMYGFHWEAFTKPEDVPPWGHIHSTVASAKGTFYCALIEHG